MSEVWNVNPKKGLGPLEFGMTRADIAKFEDILGPIEEAQENVLPNGRVEITEFRDVSTPLCIFEDGFLTCIQSGSTDVVDIQFEGVSVFKDDPKHVYSTLGRAAGEVYWLHRSVVMPSLGLELAGFVIEYSAKGKPPIFVGKKTGFTWPKLILFKPGHEPFKQSELIEISNGAG